MTTLYDRDIRAALHAHLAPRKAAGALVVDEMGVFYSDVRIDVAALDDRLSGWEIKSDRDSLARLPHQVEIYGYVFDEMTIVVGDKFASRIADHVPVWWSIAVVGETGGDRVNPSEPPNGCASTAIATDVCVHRGDWPVCWRWWVRLLGDRVGRCEA